jgi:hypothetical protein
MGEVFCGEEAYLMGILMAKLDAKITRRDALAAAAMVSFAEAARAQTAKVGAKMQAIPDDLQKTMEDYHRGETAFPKGRLSAFQGYLLSRG